MEEFVHICNIAPSEEEPLNVFDENEIEIFLYSVFIGVINTRALSPMLYRKTASKLFEGVEEGFGRQLLKIEYGTPDFEMLKSLQTNCYIFSGAKNYQQTKVVSSFLHDGDRLRSYAEFKKLAKTEFTKFNENYLRTEYNTAIAQARAARLWQDIEKDKGLYPQLRYNTIGDKKVRREHALMDKTTRPVDDKFWDKFFPPNGWNCRCTVTQTGGKKNTDVSKLPEPSEKQVPEMFRFNAGKDKIIYSPKHPYFEVAKEDKDFAKQNFNQPLP